VICICNLQFLGIVYGGTKPEVIGRAKFVLLADEIHHKIYRFMICFKSNFFIGQQNPDLNPSLLAKLVDDIASAGLKSSSLDLF
jgi:hypothetical protein